MSDELDLDVILATPMKDLTEAQRNFLRSSSGALSIVAGNNQEETVADVVQENPTFDPIYWGQYHRSLLGQEEIRLVRNHFTKRIDSDMEIAPFVGLTDEEVQLILKSNLNKDLKIKLIGGEI